jgi:hypothetical protein
MAAGTARRLLVAGLATSLSACGLTVPNLPLQPFATEKERSDFVQAVARNVRCELQDAIINLYSKNDPTDPKNRNLAWFGSWAAQLTLTLTADEKGSLAPSVNFLPITIPAEMFNVNLGASASSEATRTDKIGGFFLISDFKQLKVCHPDDRNKGPFILQGDLGLSDWLGSAIIPIGLGDTPQVQTNNVLSHEIKFEIDTMAGVTPAWKFTRVTVNQTGTLLSGNRNRTQDLTITFGPPDPKQVVVVVDPATNSPTMDPATGQPLLRPTALSQAANNAALAAEIGNAVTNGVRSAFLP